jgi:predicted GIY-YIG superfamily endonuclease
MKEFYYVYILKLPDGKHYTGCTSDLTRRIVDHKQGKVKLTSEFDDFELVFYCAFPDKYRAYAFEKYLKSGSGKAFSQKRFL